MPHDSESRFIHRKHGVHQHTNTILRPGVWPGRTLQPPGEALFKQQVTSSAANNADTSDLGDWARSKTKEKRRVRRRKAEGMENRKKRERHLKQVAEVGALLISVSRRPCIRTPF